MAINPVNIIPDNTNVTVITDDKKIVISGDVVANNINVTQPIVNTIRVEVPGPQGSKGDKGDKGDTPSTASFVQTGSFNEFTSSYYTDSSSFESRIGDLEIFSSSLDNTFATDVELNQATASLSASISLLSSSFESFSGSYNTGSFSGSFEGNLIGTASYAETASYVNPLTQSVQITGSLDVNGSGNFTDGLTVTGSVNLDINQSGRGIELGTYITSSMIKGVGTSLYLNSDGFIQTLKNLVPSSDLYPSRQLGTDTRRWVKFFSANITDNNVDGKVGIGRGHFTPTATLDVSGSGNFTDGLVVTSSIQQSGSDSYFLGNVGIGTTTPSYKLDVNGSTTSDIVSSQIGYNIDLLDNPPAIDSYTLSSGTSLSVGTYHYKVVYVTNIGETGVGDNLSVTTTTGNTTVNLSGIPISSDSRVTARKLYRTKVGATSDNQYFLATINNNTTTTYVDTIPDSSLTGANLQSYKVNTTSKFISTNDTQALILDNNLTALGLDAGRDLIANNSAAVRTVLIGKSAGQRLTTGTANVIVGQAGINLTTGGSNTIIGDLALVVGSSNTSTVIIGSQTARNITSGNNSVIIGASSVRELVGGGNVTNTSNGVYLGASIKANTNSETNAIAIGYAVDSLGSNTAVIGNDSITTTALKGNVGIGTTSPTAKLHVSGTVQFDDILSITPQDPLPSGVPIGSFAVSSSVPPKPYFYDGTNWNALY